MLQLPWHGSCGPKARSVLVPGVAVRCVVGRCLGGHPEAFIGPGTDVDHLAALAAKRAPGVLRAIDTGSVAGRAAHQPACGRACGVLGVQGVRGAWPGRGGLRRQRGGAGRIGVFLVAHAHAENGAARAQAHKVSSKAAASVQGCKGPSPRCSISRTDTISRLPLISGTRCRAGLMRSCSSWNVRPAGRFC